MYTRQRRGEGRWGGGRCERKGGTVKGTGQKGFRKRQTNKVWGHEWVERSRRGEAEEEEEEVMEG